MTGSINQLADMLVFCFYSSGLESESNACRVGSRAVFTE